MFFALWNADFTAEAQRSAEGRRAGQLAGTPSFLSVLSVPLRYNEPQPNRMRTRFRLAAALAALAALAAGREARALAGGAIAKYGGGARFVVPAPLPRGVKRDLEHMPRAAHGAIGARHYSRSDFILSPRGELFLLEINTLPGLSSLCSFPQLLESVGSGVGELAEHLIGLARRKT